MSNPLRKLVLLLAVIIFSFLSERFLEPANLSLVVQQVMVVGTLGIAQTLIILTAGIDLSVGAIMVLSSIVMAKLSADQGVPGLLALLIGFGVGTACGLVNGALVTRLRLPPFIVTLGTLNVFFALNLYYSKSETVRGVDMSDLLLWTGNTISLGDTKITYGSLIMLGMFAAVWWVLKNTAWGRHVYAAGDDAEAARLAGVRHPHRRHEPVRRPRPRDRHALRGAHRRRAAQRPYACRNRRSVAGLRRGRAHNR